MFRSLWFHKLLGLKSRSARRRQASQTRRGVRLNLEGLEDRITPSGLPYATPGNATQLQADFAFANANPTVPVTINLQAGGHYTLTDIGTQLVDKSTAGITVNGNGATITAAHLNRDFEVDHGAKLFLNNLTVTGGNLNTATAQGGGIGDFGGTLSLSGVNVTGNTIHGGITAQGGGVYVSAGGSLTIKNGSKISNNKAIGSSENGGRASASGGGVYVIGGGAVSITNSILSSDLVRGGDNNGIGFNGFGGGLYLVGGSVLTLTNSTLSNNNARGGNATGAGTFLGGSAYGGGLYVNGSGWSVTLNGSSLSGNTATGGSGADGTQKPEHPDAGSAGDGGAAFGGGAYLFGSGGATLTILSSSFATNTAQGGAGGKGGNGTDGSKGGSGGDGGSASGGALFYENVGSRLTVKSSSFDSNNALGGNGGAGGNGGLSTHSGGKGGNGGAAGDAYGGGMYLVGVHNVAITSSSVTNNNAVGGIGGAAGNGGTGAFQGGVGGVGGAGGLAYGGGVYVFLDLASVTMINTTVGANTALGGNAGDGGEGGSGPSPATHGGHGSAGVAGDAFGGGLYNKFYFNFINLINDTFAFNVAQAGSGGTTTVSSAGGGIWANQAPKAFVFLTNDILEGNVASTGGDYFGYVGTPSTYNFISNTTGIHNAAVLFFGHGNILNDTTPQLATTTPVEGPAVGSSEDPGNLQFFPLLANSRVINAGTNTVQADIADAEGVPIADITDEIGNARIVNSIIDMGAVEFFVASTNITVSPVTVTFTAIPSQVQLTAAIGTGDGELINEGTVTFTVTDSNNQPVGGTVAGVRVINGVATASFTVPGNQPAGTYTITAKYSDPLNGNNGGRFGSITGTGVLTVNQATPARPTTTVVPGNDSLTESSSPQTAGVVVSVNASNGDTVNTGTVTVTLYQGTTAVSTNSASLVGSTTGSVTVNLAVPANFPVGSYTMVESYTDGTTFGGNTANGTLTITKSASPPTTNPLPVSTPGSVTTSSVSTASSSSDTATAWFTLLVDTTELVLVMNNITTINGVKLPSAAFLVAQMQANFSLAGPFAEAALVAGINAGNQAVAALK